MAGFGQPRECRLDGGAVRAVGDGAHGLGRIDQIFSQQTARGVEDRLDRTELLKDFLAPAQADPGQVNESDPAGERFGAGGR